MEDLISYVSAMGHGRNRTAVEAAGLRMLISPLDPRDPGPNGHCLDNGAWPAFQTWLKARKAEGLTEGEAMALWVGGAWQDAMLDEDAFERALERYGATADFVVLPDIVAAGHASLAFSQRWMNRCLSMCDLVLVAVQDGMVPADVEGLVGSRVGIFLGGSTEWKLATAEEWGRWCAARPCAHPLSRVDEPRTGCWFHYARVNTERRYRRAHAAGADSVDGSSAAKFPSSLGLVTRAAKAPGQMDLLHPRRLAFST